MEILPNLIVTKQHIIHFVPLYILQMPIFSLYSHLYW